MIDNKVIENRLMRVMHNILGCPADYGLVDVACVREDKNIVMSCTECWTRAIMNEEV